MARLNYQKMVYEKKHRENTKSEEEADTLTAFAINYCVKCQKDHPADGVKWIRRWGRGGYYFMCRIPSAQESRAADASAAAERIKKFKRA